MDHEQNRIGFAEFVAWESRDPYDPELINDARAWTWTYEAEHSLLEVETGGRAIVRGGRDGIRFRVERRDGMPGLYMEIDGREVRVVRILWHTHPEVTGPSDGDLETLAILGQDESRIYELRGDPHGTLIRPKAGRAGG